MAAITMQDIWTLQVSAVGSTRAQRLLIEGARVGNGAHDVRAGQRVHVQGDHWTVRVQHRPPGEGWRDSSWRLGLPTVEAGLLRVEITAGDDGHDGSRHDLRLVCTLPISRCEHVVYGEVTVHDPHSPFNPRRDDYLVVDPPVDAVALCERYPALEPLIARLYPQRLHTPADTWRDTTPLVLPNGWPATAIGLRFDSRADEADACGADEAAAVERLQASVTRVPFRTQAMDAGAWLVTRAELGALRQLRDELVRQPSDADAAPGMTLAFQRYHRSASEAAGGAYRGTGLREPLGHAVTDSRGRYLFRFRQRGDVAPDLLVQLLAGDDEPGFETAPYGRVAHLRRIDLCAPRVACWIGADGIAASAQEKRAAEAALCRRRCS